LFGFFNSVDNRFNATNLLRAMAQFRLADENMLGGDKSNRMLLVLLDEMNLAYVELYFSELLSKLELRRGQKNEVYLDIDLGAGVDKYKLQLSENVLWVGTMNEDETTKTLSDKVIDRGNLLSFPRPSTFVSRPNVSLAEESPYLSRSTWKKWLNNRASIDDTVAKLGLKSALEEINRSLEVAGRAIGHRVWQSVEYYISVHPKVVYAKTSEELEKQVRLAYEEALVHKLMPKLRGIDTTGALRNSCLMPIMEIIGDKAAGIRHDFEFACNEDFGFFAWRSAHYLSNND
jgi:5-methylcytosine-specific restriction endonuclease McrBC GTP-binding regulatory subunit McrB